MDTYHVSTWVKADVAVQAESLEAAQQAGIHSILKKVTGMQSGESCYILEIPYIYRSVKDTEVTFISPGNCEGDK